ELAESDKNVVASARSTVFATACNDAQRRVKLSAFVQYGSAYQIEQWAPPSHFDRWQPVFRNMLSQFTPGTGTLIPGVTLPVDPASEQETEDSEVVAPEDAASEAEPGAETDEADESESTETAAPVDLTTLPPFPLAHVFLDDV